MVPRSEMYPKRAWRTPYLDGYDSSLENIVHFDSAPRYQALHMGRVDRTRGEDKYQVHRSRFHLLVRGIWGDTYDIPCGSLGPDNLDITRRCPRTDLVFSIQNSTVLQTIPHKRTSLHHHAQHYHRLHLSPLHPPHLPLPTLRLYHHRRRHSRSLHRRPPNRKPRRQCRRPRSRSKPHGRPSSLHTKSISYTYWQRKV